MEEYSTSNFLLFLTQKISLILNIIFLSSWEPESNIDADTLIYDYETCQLKTNPQFKRRGELDVKLKRDFKHILFMKQSKHLNLAKELHSDSDSDQEEICNKKIKLF